MPLRALTVVDSNLAVIFTWAPARGSSDADEAALARLLRTGGFPSAGTTIGFCVGDSPVAVRRFGELYFAAFAVASDDELTAEELLSSAYLVVAATCEEEPPTPARLASYYGKVVVCLHEAFSGHGVQLQSSVETILRSAKLKAPA